MSALPSDPKTQPMLKPQTQPEGDLRKDEGARDVVTVTPITSSAVRPVIREPAIKSAPPLAAVPVRPPAVNARVKPRHLWLFVTFLFLVVAPGILTGWYLWTRAVDQYASELGFSVRTEEAGSAIELLGGITALSGSSSSDPEILYRFIQSQDLVAEIDRAIDLRAIWSKADPAIDPVFAYHAPGSIEDLVAYWNRRVDIYFDSSTGLIDLRVIAFTPQDAQLIAEQIFARSTEMINELSAIAREDAIRYARDELDSAVERLKTARETLTQFRNRYQIADIESDILLATGLMSALNQQLAEAQIDYDLLRRTTRANDPRIDTAQSRIEVIEDQIEQERQKLGFGQSVGADPILVEGQEAMAGRIGEFERISVDLEFAEQSYAAALAGFYAAQNEAQRQSRYLAAHIRPTLAEASEYPQRLTLFSLIVMFLFLTWSVLLLVYYSLRDRR